MPKIGIIVKAREIKKSGTGRYIWVACPECGAERWVSYRFYKRGKYKERGMCRSCAASLFFYSVGIPKGWIDSYGYRHVRLRKTDFFLPMADKASYVREHRLVMAKHLGRCLQPWEMVHHRGTKYPIASKEDKSDNRIENLQLVDGKSHTKKHTKSYIAGYYAGLRDGQLQQNRNHKKEIEKLKNNLNGLNQSLSL